MRKLKTEVARMQETVHRLTGYSIGHKAAVALVLSMTGRFDLGDAMAWRIAAKQGATGAYRLARQLEAAI